MVQVVPLRAVAMHAVVAMMCGHGLSPMMVLMKGWVGRQWR